jgi:uncharacterized protein YhdP
VAVNIVPQKTLLQINVDGLDVSNADADVHVSGTWRSDDLGPGVARLAGTLKRMNLTTLHKYLPTHLPTSVRAWVRNAVTSGSASDGTFTLNGPLWHFPFTQDKNGVFEIKSKISGVTLDYADRWPNAEAIDAALTFRGSSLLAQVSKATISGVPLSATQVTIGDMDVPSPLLDIRGSAEGPTDGFLRFVAKSPVNEMLDRFVDGARASGNGRLNLTLALPLGRKEPSAHPKIDGEFAFENNRIELGADVPVLENVNGKLRFSDGHCAGRACHAQRHHRKRPHSRAGQWQR